MKDGNDMLPHFGGESAKSPRTWAGQVNKPGHCRFIGDRVHSYLSQRPLLCCVIFFFTSFYRNGGDQDRIEPRENT